MMTTTNRGGREPTIRGREVSSSLETDNAKSVAAMAPPEVVKYPRTVHLFDTGGTALTSDDLVASDLTSICTSFADGRPIFVEEKVDGANLGVRVVGDEIYVQNRSHYISCGEHAQFSQARPWIEEHRGALMELLGSERLVLYGEWCTARHSLRYDQLPGYFIAFDILDLNEYRFYSRARFHSALRDTGIPVVPTIGVFTSTDMIFAGPTGNRKQKNTKPKKRTETREDAVVRTVKSLLDTPSMFRKDGGTVEGVVLRLDNRDWTLQKFKVVRPDFVGGCASGHWSRRPIEKQVVDYAFALSYLEECYVFAGETKGSLSQTNHEELNSKGNCIKREPQRLLESNDMDKILRSRRRRVPCCIMLMGLPCSGKSTFANCLAHGLNRDVPNDSTKRCMTTLIANQDSLGHKECLQVASRASGNSSKRTRVIIDRCNLTESERQEWVRCMHSPAPGDVALVFFAASSDTCTRRVELRLGHATVHPGKASSRIVEQQAANLEPPTDRECKQVYGTVDVVRAWEEADAVLSKWGVVVKEEAYPVNGRASL